ncbi:MAG: VCBS repeat-containing protein [Proteobacteria bacterium]|nr:VCBS repeat-containing protein [Pseudomonadota bacterium]MCP4916215.1 VCBS repeat-containing protein [Pseudomonadota bacterium]
MFLLALACSDYNLNPEVDNTEPWDSAGYDDVCDKLASSGEEVQVLGECVVEPTIGGWTPTLEWANDSVGDAYATPVVGNLDNDPQAEIVVNNAVGVTYVLDGITGEIQWTGGSLGAEPMTSAIGDLDGDGRADVVSSGVGGTIAFRGDGTTMWSGQAAGGSATPQCGAVGIHDLDGDGLPEVVLGSTILDGTTGALRGQGGYGSGAGHAWAAPMGVAADIDLDGILEVVVGNALYKPDGTAIWANGQSDGFVAVGNFDDDPKGEIVVAYTGTLRLQDDDGSVIWNKPGLTGSTIGPPTIADFDGDGEPEIGVAGNGVYMVVEGSDGSVRWGNSTQDYSSGFTGSAVFDFEGDGVAEVVYADENDVWVYNGVNGEVKLQESRHSSATCSEFPSVADVDDDGHAEIIYTSSAYSGSERGVRVIGDANDSWQSARPVWNQHAYAITMVDDDGTIPTSPDPTWENHNTFRSGDVLAGLQGELPDLSITMDVCELHCEDNEIVVWVQIANHGASDVTTPFPVELAAVTADGHETLATFLVEETVPSGWSLDEIELRADLTGLDVYALVAKVDGGDDELGVIAECDEWNDQAAHNEAVCQ